MNLSMARREIVRFGRMMWEKDLIAGTDGNLSVRLPGDIIVATPSALPKGELKPEDLIRLGLDGKPLRGERGRPSSEIRMHLAAYRVRPDIGAVCHAHPPHATAFAAAGLAMDECVVPELIVTLGAVPLAPFATPSTDEVPSSIEPIIRETEAVLLENHGVLTVGKALDEAYLRMEAVEHAARIIILSRALGGPKARSREEVARLVETRGKLGIHGPRPECTPGDHGRPRDHRSLDKK